MSSPMIAGPLLLLAAAMCGCVGNPAVVTTAPGIYKVTRRGANGFTQAGILSDKALQAANEYCAAKNQAAVISMLRESPPPFWFGNFPSAEAIFYCSDQSGK